MRILIVDDEPDTRDTLAELFQDEGFDVVTAVDGMDALHVLAANELPCVVVLDLVMPVLDGPQLYARMQADPRLQKLPVIVSSSDLTRAPNGLKAFRKPVSFDRLLDAVRAECSHS